MRKDFFYDVNSRFTEESVIFVSIFKWFVLATAIGVVIGLSTTLFVKALDWSVKAADLAVPFYILLPIALVANVLFLKYVFPSGDAHTTDKVIEYIHKFKRIPGWSLVTAFFAPIITIAGGGSVGKEAPAADIGATIGSIFGNVFRLDSDDARKLTICGISAGFAAVFGTPLAGAVFGIEVLFVGSLLYEVLLPSFIAGITAYGVSSALGIPYFYHPIDFVPVFTEAFFIKVVIAGVFFGLCTFLLIEVLKRAKAAAKGLPGQDWVKALVAGLVLSALALVFSTQYLGLGMETINGALSGSAVVWYAFLLKMVFTGITLGFGGSGGIVTPVLFIGAAAGSVFAHFMGLDPATFAAIGLVAVLAGATNTPIAASILSVELFGAKLAPYAMVACVISFIMTGHRSVYPSQVLSMKKSSSLDVETGKRIHETHPHYHRRDGTLVALMDDTVGEGVRRTTRSISHIPDHLPKRFHLPIPRMEDLAKPPGKGVAEKPSEGKTGASVPEKKTDGNDGKNA